VDKRRAHHASNECARLTAALDFALLRERVHYQTLCWAVPALYEAQQEIKKLKAGRTGGEG
jgi:hypothetical protein